MEKQVVPLSVGVMDDFSHCISQIFNDKIVSDGGFLPTFIFISEI